MNFKNPLRSGYLPLKFCYLHKKCESMPYSALNEILNCRRPLTEKTALLFEAALGIDAEPLLRLQTDYNLRKMRRDNTFKKRLADIRKAASLH